MAAAADEFGVDRHSLAKRIKTTGIEPGPDGMFSTFDMGRAVYGDLHGEQLRKTREEADKLALANEKERGNLVETAAVYKALEGVFVAVRQKILASSLLEEEKDELLNELRGLKDRDFTESRGGRRRAAPAV